MKISAVIITKNEERNIERCLRSLEGVVDEIVVIDSQSTDRTQEICAAHGARVIQHKWLGYAATKNYGNAQAEHPWILSLDADEALSPELREELFRVKPSLDGVYEFNRLAFYCGKPIKHCGWYPDRKPRLFHREQARWQGEFVHETLVADSGVSKQCLKGDLLHYTYYTIAEHVERSNKYSELAAMEIADSGKGMLGLRAQVSPTLRFIKMYLFKAGFLEGPLGYAICRITANEVFLKYTKAAQIRREKQLG